MWLQPKRERKRERQNKAEKQLDTYSAFMLRRIWINKDSLQHIVARSLLGYHSSLSGCFFSPAPKREKERGERESPREKPLVQRAED